MLLAGCVTSNNDPNAVIGYIPPVPSDVASCDRPAVSTPDRSLNAGETEKYWKQDRASLRQVRSCLRRLNCQYIDARNSISKSDEPKCEAEPIPEDKSPKVSGSKRKRA